MFRIGVDLGGTKIELLAMDAAGRETFRKRVPTPQGDYEGTVDSVVSLVGEAERALKERATVGIGIPGAMSRVTGLVKNANSTCLIGHDLKGDLEKSLAREVRIANDAITVASGSTVSKMLFDVNGGDLHSEYSGPESGSPKACRVESFYCASGREWEVLVEPFMEG